MVLNISGVCVSRYEKGILTHSKGRLLAYLVWFGKIKCTPSVPASVIRTIGYKSRGHWSLDIEGLINDGYITVEGGYYKPTGKTRNLLQPLINLKKVALLNLLASGIILLESFLIYEFGGQPLLFIWTLLIAVYLAVANMHVVRHLICYSRKQGNNSKFRSSFSNCRFFGWSLPFSMG